MRCLLLRWGAKTRLRVGQNHAERSNSRPHVACFYAGEQKCVRVLPAFALGNKNAPARCLLLRWGAKTRPRVAYFCAGEEKRARVLLTFALGNENAPAHCLLLHWGRKTRLRIAQNHIRQAIRICALVKTRLAEHLASARWSKTHQVSNSRLHIVPKCAELLLPRYSPSLPAAHCRILLRHIGALPCDTSAHTSATRSRTVLRRSCAIAAPA